MYTLVYWPFLPGRGEFVRLLLEDTETPYIDLGRKTEAEGGGISAVRRYMYGAETPYPAFAPPFLLLPSSDDSQLAVGGSKTNHKTHTRKLAQMPAILAYLGQAHGRSPHDSFSQYQALQILLTISDCLDEIHNVHHPLGKALSYEEQKEEATLAASTFHRERLPKWLSFFENVLGEHAGPYLNGPHICYSDLALFQLVAGLRYAFPAAMQAHEPSCPQLTTVHHEVAQRPTLAPYLASDRRLQFNNNGIFRAYPELDRG